MSFIKIILSYIMFYALIVFFSNIACKKNKSILQFDGVTNSRAVKDSRFNLFIDEVIIRTAFVRVVCFYKSLR